MAQVQDAAADALGRCTAIVDDAARLSCYDRLAGRTVEAPAKAPLAALPVAPVATAAAIQGPGILATFWELDEDLKRGTFKFMTYKPNFLLPLHFTERLNRSPSSPTREPVELNGYRRTEAKMQLSIRTKVAQSVLLPGADLWFGYTQQSLWQVWNSAGSSPFRTSDYEPELMYVLPTPPALRKLPFGWRWEYTMAAVAHQSNGQSKPLSRSWNRAYGSIGLERGEITVTARALKRFAETGDDDDNPDLTGYRGRGEIQASWSPGRATASAMYRSTFRRFDRGALQLDLTYPVHRDDPTGLRWYLQIFSGYGETLTDYNFRQTSVGLGVAMFEF